MISNYKNKLFFLSLVMIFVVITIVFTVTWIWNVAYPAVAPPMIISSAPSSPVNDTAPATRTFNITVNQTVNVTWYFNSILEQSNTSVTSVSYTKTTNLTGRHNVTAIAQNANGTAMQTWEWNVSAPQVAPSPTPKPKVPRKPIVGKLEVLLIPENPTVYDNVSMEVRLTYLTAGYKVKFGNASIRNNTITINIDSQEPKGMAAQVITTYSEKYNLGYLSEGAYNCEVYINGVLSEDHRFTVVLTAATPKPAPGFEAILAIFAIALSVASLIKGRKNR